jgi:hypothetical protein
VVTIGSVNRRSRNPLQSPVEAADATGGPNYAQSREAKAPGIPYRK